MFSNQIFVNSFSLLVNITSSNILIDYHDSHCAAWFSINMHTCLTNNCAGQELHDMYMTKLETIGVYKYFKVVFSLNPIKFDVTCDSWKESGRKQIRCQIRLTHDSSTTQKLLATVQKENVNLKNKLDSKVAEIKSLEDANVKLHDEVVQLDRDSNFTEAQDGTIWSINLTINIFIKVQFCLYDFSFEIINADQDLNSCWIKQICYLSI